MTTEVDMQLSAVISIGREGVVRRAAAMMGEVIKCNAAGRILWKVHVLLLKVHNGDLRLSVCLPTQESDSCLSNSQCHRFGSTFAADFERFLRRNGRQCTFLRDRLMPTHARITEPGSLVPESSRAISDVPDDRFDEQTPIPPNIPSPSCV